MGHELVKRFPRVRKLLVDSGYTGKLEQWVKENLGWDFEVVKRTPCGTWRAQNAGPQVVRGFQVLKWRWIVERTFAWIGRYRRMSKDYEAQTSSAEAWIFLAMTRLMLRRLI